MNDDFEEDEPKRVHRIPRGVNLNLAEFRELLIPDVPAEGTSSETAATRLKMEAEIKHIRARTQMNRKSLFQMRSLVEDPIAQFRLQPKIKYKKTSNKWSQHEIMLAIQCNSIKFKEFL